MTDYYDEDGDRTAKLDLSLWRPLLGFLRPYRKEVALLVISGIGVASVDTALPLITRSVIDHATALRGAFRFGPYVTVYAALTGILCVSIWTFIRMCGEIRAGVGHDIRRAGFQRLQELSFAYYDRRPVGWLMARMTSDCDRLSNVFAWGVLDLTWGTTLLLFLAIVMFSIDAQLALVVVGVIPVLAWVSAVFRKRILKTARRVRKTNSRITASYNEGILGVTTSKVFVREGENLAEFRELSTDMFGASVRNALHSALFLPIVLALGSVATGLALAVGGFDVTAGRITVGTLILFVTYSRQFFDPVHELAFWFAELQMAQASAERVMGLLGTEPEIRDSAEALERIRRVGHPERFGEIEFRGVSFAYEKGPPVLEGFDLRVRAGETIALVGETGGGKTTIVSLLCRFYEPTAGGVYVDGVEYRKLGLGWLQSELGIVLQEPHLFSGTIGDNIRFGRLDATDEEVRAAARLAGADDFISAMEDGYATEVGEGGVRLSTGQKQLVSFARAILKEPRILVMDEATSSVDTETEKRIQTGLANVLSGRTSFVIAHRLSTIRDADRILVIENGRIVESGSHRELMANAGRYRELYLRQSLRDDLKGGRTWSRA